MSLPSVLESKKEALWYANSSRKKWKMTTYAGTVPATAAKYRRRVYFEFCLDKEEGGPSIMEKPIKGWTLNIPNKIFH